MGKDIALSVPKDKHRPNLLIKNSVLNYWIKFGWSKFNQNVHALTFFVILRHFSLRRIDYYAARILSQQAGCNR
jgi:hypothetical protein